MFAYQVEGCSTISSLLLSMFHSWSVENEEKIKMQDPEGFASCSYARGLYTVLEPSNVRLHFQFCFCYVLLHFVL